MSTVYSNLMQGDRSTENAARAYELRDRVSERERFYIVARYQADQGELQPLIDTYELWKQTYPRDIPPRNNLALRLIEIGNFERAVEEGAEANRIDPANPFPYSNLGAAYMSLGKLDEAEKILSDGIKRHPDSGGVRFMLFDLAFIRGDEAGMARQLEWSRTRGLRGALPARAALATMARGRFEESRKGLREVMRVTSERFPAAVAELLTAAAVWQALAGSVPQARATLAEAHKLTPPSSAPMGQLVAMALVNSPNREALADELTRARPRDALLNRIWIPAADAVIEIQRGRAEQAIERLRAAEQFERGWPIALFVRGQALLRLDRPSEAAKAFERIVAHPGVGSPNGLVPLARVYLARSLSASGDAAGARRAYQDFFVEWKNADSDVPILVEARSEYEKIK